PALLVVIAKRSRVVLPFCGVRNMYVVVLLPKSKIRDQPAVELSLTHTSIVKLLKTLTIPGGKTRCCCALEARVSMPLENVPLFGKFPFQPGPPIESAAVAPLASLKLYR